MIHATRKDDYIALTDNQGDEVDFVDIDDAKKIIEEIQRAIYKDRLILPSLLELKKEVVRRGIPLELGEECMNEMYNILLNYTPGKPVHTKNKT